MNDFSTEARKSAWWSTDSRRAVSGQLMDVILEKRGEKERNSNPTEEMNMGLVMQPTIGRIFSEVTGIGTRALDIATTHRNQDWLRAHYDFETDDKGLLEVKNYNGAYISRFSEPDEPVSIPATDYIQCLHQATVYGVDHVHFAVLFGGQRFRHWRLDFNEAEKEEFIIRAAKWWGYCNSNQLPEPENVEQARHVYPVDKVASVTATEQVEHVAAALKQVKAAIKDLEEKEERGQFMLMQFMAEASSLVTVSGDTLATWKAAKESRRFDAKALQRDMPEVYDRYMTTQPGSRRFLLK